MDEWVKAAVILAVGIFLAAIVVTAPVYICMLSYGSAYCAQPMTDPFTPECGGPLLSVKPWLQTDASGRAWRRG